jgi:hypothetical protein
MARSGSTSSLSHSDQSGPCTRTGAAVLVAIAALVLSVVPASAAPRSASKGARAAAPSTVLLAVSPAEWQNACPLRVAASVTSAERVERIVLFNRAPSDVVAFTLTAVATEPTPRARRLGLFSFDARVTVPAHGIASVSGLWSVADVVRAAVRKGAPQVRLTVGFTRAVLADGTVFEFDLGAGRSFDLQPASDDDERLFERLQPAVSIEVEGLAEPERAAGVVAEGSVSVSNPQWTCIRLNTTGRNNCDYQMVNGQPQCVERACGRFSPRCDRLECAQIIIVQPQPLM